MGKYDGMTIQEFVEAAQVADPLEVMEMVADVFLGGTEVHKDVELVVHWADGVHAHYEVARKGMKARGWRMTMEEGIPVLVIQNGVTPGTRTIVPLLQVRHVQLNIGQDVVNLEEGEQGVGGADGAGVADQAG